MPESDGGVASRAGWLRAAVLGADDGIVSTAALIVGVAAADATPRAVLTAGLAGIVAGALSMAAGEYVSVSSQRDLEEALRRKEEHLVTDHPYVAETELAITLQLRGLEPTTARQVAEQLLANEPVGSNVRVKYGISEETRARPLQAALTSAASFAAGGSVPLLGVIAGTPPVRLPLAIGVSLVAIGPHWGAGCRSWRGASGARRRSRAPGRQHRHRDLRPDRFTDRRHRVGGDSHLRPHYRQAEASRGVPMTPMKIPR